MSALAKQMADRAFVRSVRRDRSENCFGAKMTSFCPGFAAPKKKGLSQLVASGFLSIAWMYPLEVKYALGQVLAFIFDSAAPDARPSPDLHMDSWIERL